MGGAVSVAALADEHVLLLEDGHCLRDQALSVCHIVGAVEREGFRATSLETLRQMVAAGVAVTLLPMLAVRPPVSNPDGVALVPFAVAGTEPAHLDVLARHEPVPSSSCRASPKHSARFPPTS